MYKVVYYKRISGDQPIIDWLDKLDKRLRARIKAKIQCLEEHGLELLSTNMLKRVTGGSDLYELVAGQSRVMVHYDKEKGDNRFVLLNGFLKKRMRETRHIKEARYLLREYRSNK